MLWSTYLPLLRSASWIRTAADSGDAPAPCRRREGVRRLFGRRIGIVDPSTGEIREAEIFVGVLGASNLTYAEATWTQTLPDWTGAHVRMFRFFGGAPKLLVPDYVAGHIIGILWPPPLCGAPPGNWLLAATLGHISLKGPRAIRAVLVRFAKQVFGEAPLKKSKAAGRPRALPVSSLC